MVQWAFAPTRISVRGWVAVFSAGASYVISIGSFTTAPLGTWISLTSFRNAVFRATKGLSSAACFAKWGSAAVRSEEKLVRRPEAHGTLAMRLTLVKRHSSLWVVGKPR